MKKSKILFSMFIMVCFLFSMSFVSAASEAPTATLNVSANKTNVKPGDIVVITVSFTKPLNSVAFDLVFDRNVFDVVSYTSSAYSFDTNDMRASKSTARPEERFSSLTFTYKAKAEGSGSFTIGRLKGGIADPDEVTYKLSAGIGSVKVVSKTPVVDPTPPPVNPTPTPDPTPTPTPTPDPTPSNPNNNTNNNTNKTPNTNTDNNANTNTDNNQNNETVPTPDDDKIETPDYNEETQLPSDEENSENLKDVENLGGVTQNGFVSFMKNYGLVIVLAVVVGVVVVTLVNVFIIRKRRS